MSEPGRLPRSLARLIDVTDRRGARGGLHAGRLGESVGSARVPAALARATRLSAGRRRSARDVRREMGTAAVALAGPVGSEPAAALSPDQAWLDGLGEHFGISPWALTQLFGDLAPTGGAESVEPLSAADVGSPPAPAARSAGRAEPRSVGRSSVASEPASVLPQPVRPAPAPVRAGLRKPAASGFEGGAPGGERSQALGAAAASTLQRAPTTSGPRRLARVVERPVSRAPATLPVAEAAAEAESPTPEVPTPAAAPLAVETTRATPGPAAPAPPERAAPGDPLACSARAP